MVCSAAPHVHAQTEHLPTILITRQLATAEGLRTGDIVALSATPDATAVRRFRVAGIYEPVPDPMRLAAKRLEARLHLPEDAVQGERGSADGCDAAQAWRQDELRQRIRHRRRPDRCAVP